MNFVITSLLSILIYSNFVGPVFVIISHNHCQLLLWNIFVTYGDSKTSLLEGLKYFYNNMSVKLIFLGGSLLSTTSVGFERYTVYIYICTIADFISNKDKYRNLLGFVKCLNRAQ